MSHLSNEKDMRKRRRSGGAVGARRCSTPLGPTCISIQHILTLTLRARIDFSLMMCLCRPTSRGDRFHGYLLRNTT